MDSQPKNPLKYKILFVLFTATCLGGVNLTSPAPPKCACSCAPPSGEPVLPEALERTYGDAQATLNYVHDGDTISVDVKDWPPLVGKDMLVRVYGVDTPELHDSCPEIQQLAQAARDFTAEFMKGKPITLKDLRRDKYFRILAEVYVGDKSLGAALIAAKLAHPYDGGTKQPWTQKDVLEFKKTQR